MIIASIDIGTNTILMLIANVDASKKIISSTIIDEYRIPRIGKGLSPDKEIGPQQIENLFVVLGEYHQLIKKYNCDKVIAVATNAFRISSNGRKLACEIRNKFGFDVEIISGDDEAKFSYLGAANNKFKGANNLVIDIGGGSTEIIIGNDENILFKKSFLIGVVSGKEKYLNANPLLPAQINKLKEELIKLFNGVYLEKFKIDKTFAIAGTPTTLACLKLNLDHYEESIIEGSDLTKDEVNDFISELSILSPSEILGKYKAVVQGREDVLLCGTIILHTIMEILNLDSVTVSTKGIRYGAIVNFLLENNFRKE